MRRAEEALSTARRELENAESLLGRGVATVDRVTQARSDLAAAEADLAAARDGRDALDVTAPFAGRLEAFDLDRGEVAQAGVPVGEVVDVSPLTVEIQVPQQAIARLREGQEAEVAFVTGAEAAGTVAFVGSSADPETRTFLVEIEVPNESGAIPAGISANVRIPTGTAQAHFAAPSLVSLDPEGRLGIKLVQEGVVAFAPVEIVRADASGLWVTGLPARARVITVGQGFVRDGERVTVRPEAGGDAAAPAREAGQ